MDGEMKERLLQAHDPTDGQQQDHPRSHGEAETDQAAFFPLLQRQAVDQDRDEDDVVDAKDDFQQGQGEQRGPGVRVIEPAEFEE